jgi:hypothetical protein
MPDTLHWIVVRAGIQPYEVKEDDLADELNAHGEVVHLVEGRVWRDYQATLDRLGLMRDELRSYRRAAFVPRAVKVGFPIPSRGRTESVASTEEPG